MKVKLNNGNQPPQNKILITVLITIILPYSPIKNKAKPIAEYSVLKPETSTTYELGMKDYVLDNTFISASIFRLEKEDEITGYKIDGDNSKYFRNEAETTRNGLEFTMENYFGDLTLSSGFVYMDPTRNNNTINSY